MVSVRLQLTCALDILHFCSLLLVRHGLYQLENLRHAELASLARAAEQSRQQQLKAEEEYHEDLQALVGKSKEQQAALLATFEVQHGRETDEMLSTVALQQSEKLNEVRDFFFCFFCFVSV